jgi:hypothetical protein
LRVITGFRLRAAIPPPWSVEEQSACFVVRDHNGQQLAYIYFEDEPGRRSAAKLLTRDEGHRIAVNIATLNRLRQNFSRPRLFVASHGYHNGDHEPGNQDSEHTIIEGCHTITAKKKAAR